MSRLTPSFFHRDCLEVAPDLVGKLICHQLEDGTVLRLRISETEAYRGEEDTACHAHKGKTPRTQVLYGPPGVLYIYLCYGMHNLLNVVTGEDGIPQGVLIRACVGAPGPGMLTKRLQLDRRLHGTPLVNCQKEVWFEDDGCSTAISTKPRVGIGYASPRDQALPWRFCGSFPQPVK